MNRLIPTRHRLRRTLAEMVQADRPLPSRTQAEFDAEVERHYRWNFAANMLDGLGFWFGLSFISAGTIIPLFVSKLTPDPLAIGLVAVVAQGAWFVPQLLTANWIEPLPYMKPVVVRLGFFLERLPVWLLVAAALLAVQAPTLALVVFFAGYIWRGLGSGVVAPAWQDMIARCFPVARRGRFMGITNFFGAGAGAAGAALSTWLLKTYPFPTNFAYIFCIAGLGLTASWFFLSLTREPTMPAVHRRQAGQGKGALAELPGILRSDHNFRRFLAARSLLALGGMGMGFVTVAAVQRWQVPDSTVGLYTAALFLGETVGYLAFGFLADRFGHKLSLELGALASTLAFALAWLAPSPGWIVVVFVLAGINLSAIIGSGILVALEFCEPQRRPSYIGTTNTTVGIFNMAAPLLGAWLAGYGYDWTFALAAAFSLASLGAMRLWVREPRWASEAQALEG